MKRLAPMAILACILLLGACESLDVKPLDKAAKGYDAPDEIPSGPGVFSGEKGEFEVL
ncbi:MAG: hypothetical protein O3A96_10820 [Proteobacteria bacterium]|nr:hypothetical protein [Pseudomonadota bacterium]